LGLDTGNFFVLTDVRVHTNLVLLVGAKVYFLAKGARGASTRIDVCRELAAVFLE
jgi:hypothetical protein